MVVQQAAGKGGLGLFQMEKVTFNDLNDRYMPEFQPGVESAMSELFGNYQYSDLQGNDALATAFARMKYFSLPSSIPSSFSERADYWGKHYNTHNDAEKIRKFRDDVLLFTRR